MKSCSRKQLTQEYPFTRLPPEMPGQQGFKPGPTAQSRHPQKGMQITGKKAKRGTNPAQQQQRSPEPVAALLVLLCVCGNPLVLINALTIIAFAATLHGTDALSAATLSLRGTPTPPGVSARSSESSATDTTEVSRVTEHLRMFTGRLLLLCSLPTPERWKSHTPGGQSEGTRGLQAVDRRGITGASHWTPICSSFHSFREAWNSFQ